MLDIQNVSIGFKKKKVLSNITYSFPNCGLYAVVGKSGIGKTTLLNTIIGLIKPSTGNVLYNGEDIHLFSNKKRMEFLNEKIGCIFQNYSLIEDLTVEENINLGNSCTLEEVESMKRFLDIDDVCDQQAKNLSGGERQRTAIARAILKSPDIILADEPTGNLDEENSKNIMKYLKEISKNILVIMVTHNVELVKEYASCILKLSKEGLEELKPLEKPIEQSNTSLNKKYTSLKKLNYKMNKRLLISGLSGKKNLLFWYCTLFIGLLLIITLSLTILTFDKADLAYRIISKYNNEKGIVEVQKEESYDEKYTMITKGKIFFNTFDSNIIGKKEVLDDLSYIQIETFESITLIEGRFPKDNNEVIVSKALANEKMITLNEKEYSVVGVTSLFENDSNDKIVFGAEALLNPVSSVNTSSLFSIFDVCYYYNSQAKHYNEKLAENEIVVSTEYARYYNLKKGQTYEVIDKDALNDDYFADKVNMFSIMGKEVKVKEILDMNDFFVILSDEKYKVLEEEYNMFYNYDNTVLIHPMTNQFIHKIFDAGFDILDSSFLEFMFGLSFIKVYSFLVVIVLILIIILFVAISRIYYKNILLGYQRQACILSYLGLSSKYTFAHHSVINGTVLIVCFFLNWLFTFVINTILNNTVFKNKDMYKNFPFLPVRIDIILYSTLILGVLLFLYTVLASFHFKKSRIANGLL